MIAAVMRAACVCCIAGILQLERKGYFICDVPYSGSADKPAILFRIPDGRTK
jgi:hypothetical protein